MLKQIQPDISELTKVERYIQAVDYVNRGTTIREAAQRFKLNYESLRLRVHGLLPIECRRGPQLVFINDGADAGLLEAIGYRASRGMCIGTSQFRRLVRESALATSLKEVPESFPNIKWIQRWVKRHSDRISYRKGQILDAKRAECSNEETIRYYYKNLEQAISALGLTSEPSRIWNCDEIGMTAQGNCTEKVLCPKGKGSKVRRSTDRENVSLMGCINAAGDRIPPMYIFAGKRRKPNCLKDAPMNSVCAVTESSNINTKVFMTWLKWFIKQLPAERPQLLVLDGHFAHVACDNVLFALSHDVHMMVLPAHTSHFLQPLDVSIYQPYKALYDAAVKSFPLNSGHFPVKNDVAGLSAEAFNKAFSPTNIKRGFRDTGIYPLCLEIMLQKMIGGIKRSTPPATVSLGRHHAVLEPMFDGEVVSERVQEALKRRRLSLDSLHVAKLSLKMLIEPVAKPRPKDQFVDEKISGGRLLTYDEMKEQVKQKATVAEGKANARKKRVEAAAARKKARVEATAARKQAQSKRAATTADRKKRKAKRSVDIVAQEAATLDSFPTSAVV